MIKRRSSKFKSHKRYRNPGRAFIYILFSLFCLAGAAFSLWLFWTDLNQILYKQNEQSVGEIVHKHNNVQRRFGSRLAWNLVPVGSPVYNGDLIRTANLSDVGITFISGDSIELSENTFVVIHYNEETGRVMIELIEGRINLNSLMGNTSVLAGGQEVLASPGSYIIIEGTRERAGFQTVSGSAFIDDYELVPGHYISAGPEGITVLPEAFFIIQPLPNHVHNPLDGALRFMWENKEITAQEHMRIEVSPVRSFSVIEHTIDQYDNNINHADLSLAPGVWWWRIYQIRRDTGEPASAIWESRLSVSQPDYQEFITGTRPELHDGLLEIGDLTDENPFTFSRQRTLAPVPAPLPSVPAPRPSTPTLLPRATGLVPAAGDLIDGDYLTEHRAILFTWNPVPGADAYLFTLRQDSVVIIQTEENSIDFNPDGNLNNGPCVWQVEAIAFAPDGSIRLRGLIAESRFIISVPVPLAPELDDPGILYEN